MITADGRTRAEAWLNAISKIDTRVDGGRVYNLVVEIERPSAVTSHSKQVEKLVDTALREMGEQPITTVAETIFPMTEYKSGGLAQVYKYPTTIFPLIKSVKANSKGTYALRLVERRCSDGSTFNPLEHMVKKMQRNLAAPGGQRGFYELDITMEAGELKFYEAEIDKSNPIGGQCLSHLSFKLGPSSAQGRQLYLTAMYRSQYMIEKALGNYRGLAGLQLAVAKELGLEIGPLVVHATYAQLDLPSKHKSTVQALLKACTAVPKEEPAYEPS